MVLPQSPLSPVWCCPVWLLSRGLCSLVGLALPSCGWQQIFRSSVPWLLRARWALASGWTHHKPSPAAQSSSLGVMLSIYLYLLWSTSSNVLSLPILFWASLAGIAIRYDWCRIYLFTLKYNHIFKRRSPLLVLLSLNPNYYNFRQNNSW